MDQWLICINLCLCPKCMWHIGSLEIGQIIDTKVHKKGFLQTNIANDTKYLKACGVVGSLNIGEDIGVNVRQQGLLQKDV